MAQVKIYTTSVCPYCNAAKALFQKLQVDYEEISFDNNQSLREKLSSENKGWRTVPMIFIHDTFVGGFDDANALYKTGKLKELLKK